MRSEKQLLELFIKEFKSLKQVQLNLKQVAYTYENKQSKDMEEISGLCTLGIILNWNGLISFEERKTLETLLYKAKGIHESKSVYWWPEMCGDKEHIEKWYNVRLEFLKNTLNKITE